MTLLRLGDIEFLNSWLVTYALKSGIVAGSVPGYDLEVVSGVPADLNRRLLTGELDAGAVSSMMVLKHAAEFVPIPRLCIRSESAVASVLVVSRQPLERLPGKAIGVSNQGATTPVLLKILLNQRKLRLRPEVTSLRYPEVLEQFPAALLIGDEALAAAQSADPLLRWDLGEAWSAWTKLPAVYALWVIRRSLIQQKPELLESLSGALWASYEWGRSHPKELLSQMRKVFPWEANFLKSYLQKISYDLDEKAWRGLTRLAKEAERIGELPRGTTASLRARLPFGGRSNLIAHEEIASSSLDFARDSSQ